MTAQWPYDPHHAGTITALPDDPDFDPGDEGDSEDELAADVEDVTDCENDATRAAEPPAADAFGIDVAGLSPQRARLVRFNAWLASCREELHLMEQGRAAFLDQLGVPAVTDERLRKLIEADTSNFLAWMRSGASATTKMQARRFEREQLEKKLTDDKHTAEIARASLNRIEAEIDAKRRQIDVLSRRQNEFVEAVVLEEADALGAAYARQVAELRTTITRLLGLAVVLAGRHGYRSSYSDAGADVKLPGFALPSLLASLPQVKFGSGQPRPTHPVIAVTKADAAIAANPWRDFAKALAADPMAAAPLTLTP